MNNRRIFLQGIGAFIAASPAIVHIGNIMPVKQIVETYDLGKVIRIRLPNDYVVRESFNFLYSPLYVRPEWMGV